MLTSPAAAAPFDGPACFAPAPPISSTAAATTSYTVNSCPALRKLRDIGLPMMPNPMNAIRDKFVLLASQFTAPSIMKEQRARLHPDSGRPGPQSERHFAFYSPQPADGDHWRVGVREIVAGLRHHLCRRAAAVRRIPLGLRAAVPGADG